MSTTTRSKSRSSEARRRSLAALMPEARRIAARYKIIVEKGDDGMWYGCGLELPLVMAEGKTAASCVREVRQVMAFAVAVLMADGHRPPLPASTGTRDQQVNIKFSTDEKAVLDAAASSRGFKGVSDFIRAAALEAAS